MVMKELFSEASISNPTYMVIWCDNDEHLEHVEVYMNCQDNRNEAHLRFEELLTKDDVSNAHCCIVDRTTEHYPELRKGIQNDPEC
jgi:hypothetical protein